jgi:hypothetical protein
MVTRKQAKARRKNAKKSRGPKTERGKAASSRNALKFGFFSRDPLIPGEDAAEWKEFRSRLRSSLAPLGAAQEILADRIVDSAWRLRRFAVVEAGIFTAQLYEEEQRLAEDASWRKAWEETEAELEAAEAQIDEEEAEVEEGELEDAELEEEEFEEVREPDEIDKQLAEIEQQAREASQAPETALGRAFIRDSGETTAFLKLGRYEAGIERSLGRNLQALERLQAIQKKLVRKNPESPKKAKLQNDLTEGLTVRDRAA